MVFTELGHRVVVHARRILAAHDAALADLGAAEEKVLLIGATEHGADVMLPGLTDALGERLPDWRIRFRLDRNVTLADAIEHGLVDLAVMLDGSGWDRSNASGMVALKWVSARGFVRAGRRAAARGDLSRSRARCASPPSPRWTRSARPTRSPPNAPTSPGSRPQCGPVSASHCCR